MLGIALATILLWGGTAAALQALLNIPLPQLHEPAFGWPLFLLLAILYFITTFCLLGSLMLGVGSLAGTVREVQMLSLPVTFAQLALFFIAHAAAGKFGQPVELFAAIFPFSSPFAMVARAAQQGLWWPHPLALAWQALWVAATIRIGARLFRRNVIQSQPGRWNRFWRR